MYVVVCKYHNYLFIVIVFETNRVLSRLKRKAGVFKFLRFEERFRKAPFSCQNSVDGRPILSGDMKALYLISFAVNRAFFLIHQQKISTDYDA